MSEMERKDKLPRVMTPAMIAELWGCSQRHVRNVIATGDLPSFRIGVKLIRVLGSEVEAYERRSLPDMNASPPMNDEAEPAEKKRRSARPPLISRAKLNWLRHRG
jgi:excisionase family DNA binding protein